jgi:hypothetical protein
MASRSASYLASSPEASVTLCFGESNAVAFTSRLENISVLDESPWDLTIISTAEQLIGWMRHEFLIAPNLTNARESFFGKDGCRWIAELLSRSIALPFGAAPVSTGIDDFAHSTIITTRHSNNEPISLQSTQLCNMDNSSTSSKIAPKLLYCLVKNGFLTYSCGGSAPDESVMLERSSIFSFDLPSDLMNVSYVHLTPSRSASEVSQLLLEMATNCPFSQMPQPQHNVALRMDHLSCELQRIRLEGMNQKDLLCFYINIYNFMVVHAKLKGKLPVFSGTVSHNRDRIAAFQRISYLIGNKIHNLFNIECSLLGRSLRDSVNMTSQFGSWDTTSVKSKSTHSSLSPEPRLLFLLCKGSVSCPKIRMVTADILPYVLKTAMKDYIADHRNLPTTHSKLKSFFQGYRNSLWLPRIFKWHAGDFGLCAYDTIMFYLDQLEEYESREFRSTIKTTTCSTKIEFHLYDWTDRKTNWFASGLDPASHVESVPTPPIPITSPAFQRHVMASPRYQSHGSPRLESFTSSQTHSPALFSPRTPAVIAAIPFSPPPAPVSPRGVVAGVPLSARKFVSSGKKLPGPPTSGSQAIGFQPSYWDSNQRQLELRYPPLHSSSASEQIMTQLGSMAELDARFESESANFDFLESYSLSKGSIKAGSVTKSGYSPPLADYNSYSESAQYQNDGDFMEAESDEFSESDDDMLSQGSSWLVDDASHATMPLDRQNMGGLRQSMDGLQALNFQSTLTTASSKLASLNAANAFRLAKSASMNLDSPRKNIDIGQFSEAQAESF